MTVVNKASGGIKRRSLPPLGAVPPVATTNTKNSGSSRMHQPSPVHHAMLESSGAVTGTASPTPHANSPSGANTSRTNNERQDELSYIGKAANMLRKAAKKLILSERFEPPNAEVSGKKKRRPMAPFSVVSPYQRVRALLDPVRDRHLLGSEELHSARGQQGASDRSSHHAKIAAETLLRAPLHARGTTEQDDDASPDTAFDPDVDVPLDTVMVSLEQCRGSNNAIANDAAAAKEHNKDTGRKSSIERRHTISDGKHSLSHDHKSVTSSSSNEAHGTLPDGREIALLPPELAITFYTVAKERLQKLLLPRILFVLQRKRLKALERDASHRSSHPVADQLKKFKLFAMWPNDALNHAVDLLTYRCVEANRFIWHTGEPGGTLGIVVLTHGTCRSLKNCNRSSGQKKLTPESTVVVSVHNPGHMFNEYSFVTEEPQMRYVKTASRCDLWCLDRAAFDACCAMLPDTVKSAMTQLAFHRRQKMIPESYPFHPLLLKRQCPTFAKNSDVVLNAIIQAMTPLATHANHILSREGETPNSILFLRRGRVGSFQDISGVSTHIRTIYSPATLLESCVLHRQENMELLKTLTDCDFLTISLEDIHSIMSQYPAEKEILLEVSREENMKILSKQQLRFRPLMYQIPVVRQLLDSDQISTLSHLFEGRVYAAMETIISKTSMCDRVIVLTKGVVSCGKKGELWQVGESVGYTCIIPHRWAHTVVALQQCECIELKRDFFLAFLEDCGKLEDAKEVVDFILSPQKFKLQEEERILVEHGVQLTEGLRKLHREGKLTPSPAMRSYSTCTNASPTPSPHPHSTPPLDSSNAYYLSQTRTHNSATYLRQCRLSGITHSVLRDIVQMVTPPMFHTSESKDGVAKGSYEPGFVECKPKFSVTDLEVPGGLYVPTLTEGDKQDALASALFAAKRNPPRRSTKITPFLIVKQ